MKMIGVKLVVCIATAVGLIYALTSPSLSDPILNFCLAGVVPGSDRVIPPEIIMRWATVGLGLCIISILMVWLIRRVRARRFDSRELATPELETHRTQAVQAIENEQSVYRRPKDGVLPTGKVKTLPAPAKYVADIAGKTKRYGRWLLRVVSIALMALTTLLMWFTELLTRGICNAYSWATAAIRSIGPYAKRFDKWLEKQYRRATAWLAKRCSSSEVVQVIRSIRLQVSRNVRQLVKAARRAILK